MPSGIELVKIKSLTTEVDLFSARSGPPLEISEYSDKGIVCLLPRLRIAPGQLVSLEGIIHVGAESFRFSATGKIVRSLEAPENLTRLEIDLHQYEKCQWKKFLDHLAQDQERVTVLLKKIKGEE